MTREEKVKILKSRKEEAEADGYVGFAEALGSAIGALEQEPKILNTLDFAIDASTGDTNYFIGFRNGLRYSKSLIDEKDPQFERCAEQEPITERIEYGTDGNPYVLSMTNGKELEQEPRWIPIVTRKPTEEEKKDYFEQNGEELCYMIDSPMPDNGQEVLVSGGGHVSEDVFDEDFYNFENWDIENVEAWMPLPKPYEPKERSDEE